MLRQLTIRRFRCFEDLTVALGPLTVLIGPNDSGKSAFFAAIGEMAAGRPGTSIDRRSWWRQQNFEPRISAVSEDGVIAGGVARAHLQPLGYYSLPPQGVPLESQGVADTDGAPQLGAGGEQTAAFLDCLLRRDRPRFLRLRDALCTYVPGLGEIEVATPEAARRRIDLVVENGLRLEPPYVSAGVRLLLFFVALAYHPDPPRLILIEEPENGIHPKRLADVVRLLRDITEGKHGGSATQVLLTTHSPYLLDQLNLDTDQVLVFRRLPDGNRTAEPADRERLKQFLGEFMLGEVWYNQSEEGLVAKRS